MIPRKILFNLDKWAGTLPRKPLIIEGAFRTGKTFVAVKFAKKFHQKIHIDLNEAAWQKVFLKQEPAEEILSALFFLTGKSHSIKRTLIFLDEVCESPSALRWMEEIHTRCPDLYLLAASSRQLPFPERDISGKPDSFIRLFLSPCSFSEFLEALGDRNLVESYQGGPVSSEMREKLTNKIHLYSLIGGMPEIIQQYLQDRNLSGLKPIYEQILEYHLEKIDLLSGSNKKRHLLRFTLQNAFPYAATRIKFRDFGNAPYQSREMGESFRQLEKLRLLKLVYPVTSTVFPMKMDIARSPRLHMLDVGMVNYFSGIQKHLYHSDDLRTLFKGQIARQVIGQELAATDPLQERLNFWIRPKLQSTAEVDFVVPFHDQVIPVEIKQGETGRLRSLFQFMDESPHPFALRLYAGPLSISQTQTIRKKKFFLMSLPYFLAGRVEEHLEDFVKFVNAI
jgi:hypothetical protein